jgi:hypothetical protein
MAEGSSLRLRFFKDGVYGTVATLVFSLLGRVEKYTAAVHVVSFGCMALSPAWSNYEIRFPMRFKYLSDAQEMIEKAAVLQQKKVGV